MDKRRVEKKVTVEELLARAIVTLKRQASHEELFLEEICTRWGNGETIRDAMEGKAKVNCLCCAHYHNECLRSILYEAKELGIKVK